MDENLPQPGNFNQPLPEEPAAPAPSAPPQSPDPAPSAPPLAVASAPQSRTGVLAGVVGIAIVALLAVGYLISTGRQPALEPTPVPVTQEIESEATIPAEKEAQTGQQDFFGDQEVSAVPIEEVAPSSAITVVGQPIRYQLPQGWTESQAEGQVTPQINFLKRLRSPDSCHTVVVAQFQTGSQSLSDFVVSQYPGNTLNTLQHTTQFPLSGAETFTVKPQSSGESFTFYAQGSGMVHGVFASYNQTPPEGTACQPESQDVFDLMQSVRI